MARRSGSGKTPRQALGAASFGSDFDRQPKTPGLDLPADLDRLGEAVSDEIRRRGRGAPDSPSMAGRSPKRMPAKAARAKPSEPDRAATVTPGQEPLIVAAFEAGLRPAAIAKEFRGSRSTVQHVIIAAQRDRRTTER